MNEGVVALTHRQNLLAAMNLLLAAAPLSSAQAIRRRRGWRGATLARVALLMAWSESASLADRFRSALLLAPRRVGRTYQGWVKASRRWSPTLLRLITRVWRERVRSEAGGRWSTDGWVVMGVDGSKYDLPRTAANEKAFGVSGKRHGGPQACLCMILQLATGLPWYWKIGRVASSERHLLRQMVPLLPARCLLVVPARRDGLHRVRPVAGARGFGPILPDPRRRERALAQAAPL